MARRNRYKSSKLVLTGASFLAFGSLAGLISSHGPFGNTPQAPATAVSVQQAAPDANQMSAADLFSDDGADDDTYTASDRGQYFSVPDRGPVATSRGS
jgi:hypothetical protein